MASSLKAAAVPVPIAVQSIPHVAESLWQVFMTQTFWWSAAQTEAAPRGYHVLREIHGMHKLLIMHFRSPRVNNTGILFSAQWCRRLETGAVDSGGAGRQPEHCRPCVCASGCHIGSLKNAMSKSRIGVSNCLFAAEASL
jgi:hypothetical protein